MLSLMLLLQQHNSLQKILNDTQEDGLKPFLTQPAKLMQVSDMNILNPKKTSDHHSRIRRGLGQTKHGTRQHRCLRLVDHIGGVKKILSGSPSN